MAAGPYMDVRDDAVVVTAEGYERLGAELEALRTEGRREMAEALRVAREDGDLADNPSLLDALDEQAYLEHRIAALEDRITCARIVDPPRDGRAGIGARVRLRDVAHGDVVEYELVSAVDAAPDRGRLSVDAPVGRALMGRPPGALVEVAVPHGTLVFEILAVDGAGAPPGRAAA